MNLGLIDVDLLANKGSRFPNLALMKIASRALEDGAEVSLVLSEDGLASCDALSVSKVFTSSLEPSWLTRFNGRIERGGTGYFYNAAPPLDASTERAKPYYAIYQPFVDSVLSKGARPKWLDNFDRAAIGFTTRGCFRRCAFCVNSYKTRVERWSPVEEFDDETKRFIVLLDDNVFAYADWARVFRELEETGKPFCFKQGLDVRLMTKEKARYLERVAYKGEIYFAFDDVKDAAIIRERLKVFRRSCPAKNATAYVLTGYYERGVDAFESALERVEILSEYGVKPYIMRYETTFDSELSAVFSGLAAWCNQPACFKKLNYFETNERRSLKAVDDARRRLPDDILARLERKIWKS